MLRITSFYPLSNFKRVSHEFLDDKIIIRTKSLALDYEQEVNYAQIKHIEFEKVAEISWLWLGLIITIIPGTLSMIFTLPWLSLHNPLFLLIGRAIILIGVILCIPAFHKNEFYCFLDQDRNYLVAIKIDHKNRQDVNQALELVRQRSIILSDTNPRNPLPDMAPMFVHTQYGFTDYLNKSVSRFYEDKLIDTQKSLAAEVVTEVDYSELSGKVQRIKSTNENWIGVILATSIFYGSAFWLLVFMFPQLFHNWLLVMVSRIFLVALALIFVLSFVKRESFLFFNINDNQIYWTRADPRKPKDIETIIDYVKGKTSQTDAQNK